MKNILRNLSFVFLATLLACVDIFDPGLTSDVKRLVIEAQITTKLDFQYVYLTYDAAYNSDETNFKNLVSRAKVNIIDDQGKVYEFFDEIENNNQIKTVSGYNYRSVEKFKAELGRTYQLNVEVLDGRKYQSTIEHAVPVSKIDQVYSEFRELPPPTDIKGEYQIYIDTQDDPNQKNFYKWDSYNVKQINYCREWYIYGSGGSVTQAFVDNCCEVCYEKVRADDAYELANDQLINGNKISRKYVTTIPFDNITPYYLVINQYSLTEDAYKFWYAIKQQSKNSGGLFDATPKSIKGNMKNVNDEAEEVLGYFYVTDVYEHQVYIDRNRVSPKPILKDEYSVGWTKTGNCYACEESYNRTKIRPVGWVN
ncbi:DUF4249 domain-containing protein [Lacihabitans sp. LS3-19]|uniref:DUF4249 domain-containing protein n=1 Tax=Lacihabitans sp. LS3-19 TaxID=2487335 RepID=UPI0020CC2A50|nr:DUF4249 domain-containing protein [Lacihabitans sp. LS3-19]MCP9770804.1 DUF4249 domain-containing protein [Lacihabitans sp. LS3-19]